MARSTTAPSNPPRLKHACRGVLQGELTDTSFYNTHAEIPSKRVAPPLPLPAASLPHVCGMGTRREDSGLPAGLCNMHRGASPLLSCVGTVQSSAVRAPVHLAHAVAVLCLTMRRHGPRAVLVRSKTQQPHSNRTANVCVFSIRGVRKVQKPSKCANIAKSTLITTTGLPNLNWPLRRSTWQSILHCNIRCRPVLCHC